MELFENERLDDLQIEGLKIIQNKKLYAFTSDSVLLANSVKVKSTDVVCDLGSGTGIIAILLAGKKKAHKVVGVEIQKELFEMSERSRDFNGLQNLSFINQPLQTAYKTLGSETFDTVVANPPYFSVDTTQSEGSRAIGRSEQQASLGEFAQSASKLLKYGGSFYVIVKTLRFAELVKLLGKFNLEVKDVISVYPKLGRECDTVIVRAMKGGNAGMKMRALVVYNNDGTYTAEAKELYGKDNG